ncbi:MAG: dephospho-CoA kinase [Micavibrio aeruginosavorus]|uniref:Dephospho-CoA kinase n=1 Tax=Micavibrio aeruginosavorus TaxID=349221 RepID=A0A2W5FU42_9BACT|nr:MAG: dephospho-CoA kinase [Micavibrio aeruginosavorus]
MKVIGLTGSVGMGKSATASLLKLLGIAVHDSDAAVHEALSAGGGAFQEVIEAFPKAYDKKNNIIDRQLLGRIIFADSSQRKKLEAIIHPHVWESQRRFINAARLRRDNAVVLDIPLLFETGSDRKCDEIIVVTAPYFIQKQRVLRRPGMTTERFEGILASQIPDSEKRRRANYVVHTGLGRAHTLRKLKEIFKLPS